MLSLKTNTSALVVQQQSMKSGSALDESIRRLSSGMRINSASDDSAGQAIANRMTSQQRGLVQAQRNAADGLSLAETAENALGEINSRLQRIRELTVQGLSETYSQTDSDAIQAEINLNLKEIDRLNSTSSFNGIPLLNGSAGKVGLQVGANDNNKMDIDLSQGFSVEQLGLKDLVIRGISGSVSPVNTITGIANNISLTNGTVSVNYSTPVALTSPQLVRSNTTNQLYIQGTASDGTATFYPASYGATWYTATGSGTVSVGSTSNVPLYSGVSTIAARNITSVSYLDDSGNALSNSPPPTLTENNGQYYIEQNDVYYAADIQFGTSGAVTAQITNASGQPDTDFSPLPTQVSATPVIDNSTAVLTFTDANGNAVANSDARLVKYGSQYMMEVGDGSGNYQYYNASVSATSDGTLMSLNVTASSLASQNSFTAVTTVSGTSVVTLDPANVETRYTENGGQGFNDVLRLDADGNYYMNVRGATIDKTATLVTLDDGNNTLLLKTLQGVGDVQIYFTTTMAAVTDASTNNTQMSIAETGSEIRLRNPDDPLATLDKAIGRIDSQRSLLGAAANRLASIQNVQSTTSTNLATSRSRIEDADYAIEVSAMTRAQILQQSSASLLSKVMTMTPQMVLSLLEG
ncbi:flagellin N-terminal helical domain-containing protein [Pseudomonas graminis]